MNTLETLDDQNAIDNQLELLRYTSQVQSRIRNNINSDFVLAKLPQKDKEAIIELTSNAYFIHAILSKIAETAHTYTYNETQKKFIQQPLQTHHIHYLQRRTQQVFDAYMIRLTMTAILNRNVDKNHLIQILSQTQETELPTNEKPEDQTKEQLKKLLEDKEQKK